MNPKQIFLSLTASFMAALTDPGTSRPRVQRALEAAISFEWETHIGIERYALEYATWAVNRGKPPAWLPQGFNHGYLG